jgi:molecular chaperone DnaJ
MGAAGRRGDQLVELKVMTPGKLSERQTELLEELADSFGLERVKENSGTDQGIFDRFKDAFRGEGSNS